MNAMNAIRTAYAIPILLLSACGSRPVGQTPDQQGAQQDVQQGAQPTAPSRAEAASTPESQPAEPPDSSVPVPALSPSRERTVRSIPSGTIFRVRLEETLDTRRNRAGDRFVATLVDPVVENGTTMIPKGTQFAGHLTESKPSGRFKGRALLSLSLDSFELNGRHREIAASRVARASGGHKKRNWLLMGGGSGVGATIGAIAGGGAGALIGAGSGAAAGTVGAAFTGKKNVRLPVETQLSFVLRSPVAV